MSRKCAFTQKQTRAGRKHSRRGKAKYLGGVGVKTTSITRRQFKPNVQRVKAVVNGRVVRVKASAKAIRSGFVVKPPKRNYTPPEESDQQVG
ncbi:MAG: 50S ribosomal protein L28 [Phycisphaerae bacterium]